MPPKTAVYRLYIDEMGSPVCNRNDLDREVHSKKKHITAVGMEQADREDEVEFARGLAIALAKISGEFFRSGEVRRLYIDRIAETAKEIATDDSKF